MLVSGMVVRREHEVIRQAKPDGIEAGLTGIPLQHGEAGAMRQEVWARAPLDRRAGVDGGLSDRELGQEGSYQRECEHAHRRLRVVKESGEDIRAGADGKGS